MDQNENIYKPAIIQSISDDEKSLEVKFIDLNENDANLSPR